MGRGVLFIEWAENKYSRSIKNIDHAACGIDARLNVYSIVLVIRYGDSVYMLKLWNYVIDLQ